MSKGKNNSREQFVTPDLGFTPKGLYIGGTWLESVKGERFESINPSNMEILGDVPLADEDDVNRTVMAAKDAFFDWGRMPIPQTKATVFDLRRRSLLDKEKALQSIRLRFQIP